MMDQYNSFRPGRAVAIVALTLILATVISQPLHSSSFAGQKPTQKTETQSTRKTSTPYTGDLQIFEGKDRDEKLQVQRVMNILGIQAGVNVADIGAGSGWFTVRAAKRATPGGTVYAVDINPEAIAYIDRRVKSENLANVHPVLSTPDDPKLPENSVDAVLLLKTYHEIAHPLVLLKNLKKSLRSGARIGIIDRKGNGEDHGLARDVVIKEMASEGFRMTEDYDFVKGDGQDYFLVFRATEGGK